MRLVKLLLLLLPLAGGFTGANFHSAGLITAAVSHPLRGIAQAGAKSKLCLPGRSKLSPLLDTCLPGSWCSNFLRPSTSKTKSALVRSLSSGPTEVENPDFEAQLRNLDAQIARVEAQIARVEAAIQAAEDKANAATDTKERDYWRKKEEQLRREKEQLRREKEQLRREKEQLRKKEEQFRVEKLVLLRGSLSAGAGALRARKAAAQFGEWEQPEAFERLLTRCQVSFRGLEARRGRPYELVREKVFNMVGRDAIMKAVFQEWFSRHLRFVQSDQVGLDKSEILCLPSAPGMGKSRVLSAIASRSNDGDAFGDGTAKERVLTLLQAGEMEDFDVTTTDDCEAREARLLRVKEVQKFCERMRNAATLCVTFNAGCQRSADQQLFPDPKEALCMRILWSHFCGDNGYTYTNFVVSLQGLLGLTFERVQSLLLADILPEQDLIICVDELMLVQGSGPSPAEGAMVSQAAQDVLSAFSNTLDKQRRVHVLVSSLSEQPTRFWYSATKRYVKTILLRRLSQQDALAAWNNRHFNSGTDSRNRKRKAVVEQLVSDCAGAPRLLERVDNLLQRYPSYVENLQTVQALLWDTQLGQQWKNLGISRLPSVLEMVLSGERCDRERLDEYAQEGLFMQSAEDGRFPEVPPIVLGMLHRQRFGGVSGRLLDACSEMMQLDSICTDAKQTSRDFEFQMAHLLRLRLFLLQLKGKKNFSLDELLTISSTLKGTHVWRRDGARSYTLSSDSDFLVFVISRNEIMRRAAATTTGAIYVPQDGSFPGVDFFLHLPSGELISFQIKHSARDATTRLSISNIDDGIEAFKSDPTCAPLWQRTTAHCVLAHCKGNTNLVVENLNTDNIWDQCNEFCLCLEHEIDSLVPFSLALRPNLQIFIRPSEADQETVEELE